MLIIVVVFTPLFTLEGVEGKLFQPMALAIMFAMLASLAVALLVILRWPAICTVTGCATAKARLMKPLSSAVPQGTYGGDWPAENRCRHRYGDY